MERETLSPVIDGRNIDELLSEFEGFIPDTLKWKLEAEDAGFALAKVFTHMLDDIIQRLNRVPRRNFIAFLDMLGIKLLPAQPAAAPVTFILAEGTGEHVLVPAGTQVTAGDITFETEKTIFASPAKLSALYSFDPSSDEIYDHISSLADQTPFVMFSGQGIQEHILYLGHSDLFNVTKEATFEFRLDPFWDLLADNRLFNWEYWGDNENGETGWHPLIASAAGPNIQLEKRVPGEIKEKEINGIKNRWIRCKTTATKKAENIYLDTIQVINVGGMPVDDLPVTVLEAVSKEIAKTLLDNGIETIAQLPGIENLEKLLGASAAQQILAEVEQRKVEKSRPDMAYSNHDVPQDIKNMSETNPVYPFGIVPKLYNTFYIANQEALSKKNFSITINFELKTNAEVVKEGIVLSWEYWNGKGWKYFEDLDDNIEKFTQSGQVTFTCPRDIEPRPVGGQENYWIRVRIAGGDYGKKIYSEDTSTNTIIYVDEVYPPEIYDIKITYSPGTSSTSSASGKSVTPVQVKKGKLTPPGSVPWSESEPPGIPDETVDDPPGDSLCILTFNNCQFEDVSMKPGFEPFLRLADTHRILYLGFDRKLEKGPISLYFSIREQESYKDKMPKVRWFYFPGDNKEWQLLDVLDHTKNLSCSGSVEFLVPPDFEKTARFGQDIYWIKAVDVQDTMQIAPEINGVYLNTVRALQALSIEDEIPGSGDGTAHQQFKLTQIPVFDEKISVNEDGTWITWQPVDHFFDSSPGDRHYQIDRASGEITFGSGVNGRVPPVGRDNIKASYKVGGGLEGNVGCAAISSLAAAIPFVETVTNPAPAEGGADTETIDAVLERGPYLVKHRDRAVSEEDFERHARAASTFIARTKCLVKDNRVNIIIIPHGKEDQPMPSPSLLKIVETYLRQRCLNIVHPSSIRVIGPTYYPVNVNVDVVPLSIENAVPLEREIIRQLNAFLHPLTGGPEKKGWQMGRNVHISDIYAMLENIDGVDHVEHLTLKHPAPNGCLVDTAVEKDQIVCPGTFAINMKPGGHRVSAQ